MTPKDAAALPLKIVADYGKKYPFVWNTVEKFMDMPEGSWDKSRCYIPIAASIAICNVYHMPPSAMFMIPALAAWRQSKEVYTFDQDLAETLYAQATDTKIPSQILMQLPFYCVYIDSGKYRFFCHLENDVNDSRWELRFVRITENGPTFTSEILPLTRQSWPDTRRPCIRRKIFRIGKGPPSLRKMCWRNPQNITCMPMCITVQYCQKCSNWCFISALTMPTLYSRKKTSVPIANRKSVAKSKTNTEKSVNGKPAIMSEIPCGKNVLLLELEILSVSHTKAERSVHICAEAIGIISGRVKMEIRNLFYTGFCPYS